MNAVEVVGLVAVLALGALAVVAGAAVFVVNSMARATYALALSFVAVGAVLVQLDLPYIGVITVLMMVMEMAVMAIYMVMFMGMNPALVPMSMVHSRRWSLAVAIAAFVVLAGGALVAPWPTRRGLPAGEVTRALGTTLMESKMLVMMTTSLVMVAAIVAGIVLAAPRTRYDRLGEDLTARPADDPQPGGVGR